MFPRITAVSSAWYSPDDSGGRSAKEVFRGKLEWLKSEPNMGFPRGIVAVADDRVAEICFSLSLFFFFFFFSEANQIKRKQV